MKSADKNVYGTFEASQARSRKLEEDLARNPAAYRVLTGDRPTGALHIGHLFGSLMNRKKLQDMGVEVFVVIADYQVLTDRDRCEDIPENIRQVATDYLAAGLDPDKGNTFIFPHSHVPELHQLLVPFLTLVTNAELDRNPTVKEEIQAAGLSRINAGTYTYPVHQAADILFCKGNVVPVGKDQLPHLELARTIARRFNNKYAGGEEIFPEPVGLLSEAPLILGLDGSQKMSKSRNNAVTLRATEDETAKLIKKAKTDADRRITYDPENRPEVSNLLYIASLCTGEPPQQIAEQIGDQGAGRLKSVVTEALNSRLAPIRARRKEIEQDDSYLRRVLSRGVERARETGLQTLNEVRKVMNMDMESIFPESGS